MLTNAKVAGVLMMVALAGSFVTPASADVIEDFESYFAGTTHGDWMPQNGPAEWKYYGNGADWYVHVNSYDGTGHKLWTNQGDNSFVGMQTTKYSGIVDLSYYLRITKADDATDSFRCKLGDNSSTPTAASTAFTINTIANGATNATVSIEGATTETVMTGIVLGGWYQVFAEIDTTSGMKLRAKVDAVGGAAGTWSNWVDYSGSYTGGMQIDSLAYETADASASIDDVTVTVPEPTTIGLLCLGGAALISRKRKVA